jgi:hypothetical protein
MSSARLWNQSRETTMGPGAKILATAGDNPMAITPPTMQRVRSPILIDRR